MSIELVNGFGKVYLTIAYDSANCWGYNNWVGYQTYTGIISGADACLTPLQASIASKADKGTHLIGLASAGLISIICRTSAVGRSFRRTAWPAEKPDIEKGRW